MEQEAPGSDYQISSKGDKEDLVVAMAQTTANTLDTEPHEQQVRHGIDNLGGIDGSIVVLSSSNMSRRPRQPVTSWQLGRGPHTSSHQFSVEVTGLQYPARGAGYGIEGRDSHRGMMKGSVDLRRFDDRAGEAQSGYLGGE